MKTFKNVFVGAIASIVALLLAGQGIILYKDNQSEVKKASKAISVATDKTIEVATDSYEAVADAVKK
jgi:hypothetical protein